VADWYPWWALAKRLGLAMQFSGQTLDFTVNQPPTTEDMLAMRCASGRISFDALKADLATYPSGRIYDHASLEVLPMRSEAADARFDVMPDDVAGELQGFLASEYAQDASPGSGFSHLMISRRMNRVMNTLGNNLAGTHRHDPGNPAYMNPDELADLGLVAGDRVEIASQHGRIVAFAREDPALRRGVVSISHCWGGLPGKDGPGANTNLLIAADKNVQPINAMPLMSSLPVNLRKVA
jgi:anaerobic selenocysteine-containing dehydrogenase